MAASQAHITPSTPMGANLIADGATFRVWAPGALHVHLELGGSAGSQASAICSFSAASFSSATISGA